ncbi:conserved domain protein [delta proteobacterium NaphS2]|nr:conserved domain protein [delta proteobacterium NaphS2]
MDMKEICPCPNLSCPNHGYCEKCISRHLRAGFLNYCAFHTILPTLKQVIDSDPESPAAKKLDDLIQAQLQAYEKLMDKHGLSQESQNSLLKKVAECSDR